MKRPLERIPIISMSWLSDQKKAHEFFKMLGAAYEDIGFCYIQDHGISFDLLTECYFQSKQFFELPWIVKAKYIRKDLGYQRGWTPPKKEQALGSRLRDSKENLFFGPLNPPSDLQKRFPVHYFENIWPVEVPSMEEPMTELYQQFLVCGKLLGAALEKYLQTKTGHMISLMQDGPHLLRPICYPPITRRMIGKVLWGGEHTDLNFITLLPPAMSKGLMIRRRDGVWIEGNAPSGCIITQVGDQLQYVTGGRFLSAVHRVDAPLTETPARLSMAFFMHARSSALLSLLLSCVSYCRDPIKYPPIRAVDFVDQRLNEIKLAKNHKGGRR